MCHQYRELPSLHAEGLVFHVMVSTLRLAFLLGGRPGLDGALGEEDVRRRPHCVDGRGHEERVLPLLRCTL